MRELERHNMTRLREQFHTHPLRDAGLAALWEEISAKPVVVRHSPHRTVLRCSSQSKGDWLFKVFHPNRRWEKPRRLLAAPPALREFRLHQQLELATATAEQVTPNLGVFARPWLEDSGNEISAESWGEGLAKLHNQGWSDSDLSLSDFLMVNDSLVPLDLNHASFRKEGATKRNRRRDLVRLISEYSPQKRFSFAERLATAYLKYSGIPFVSSTLSQYAFEVSRSRFWKRSRRAWRDCSDFKTKFSSPTYGLLTWRRDEPFPSEEKKQIQCGKGGSVFRGEANFRQAYFRNQRCFWSPAKRTHRNFHLLELIGLPAATSLGFSNCCLWTLAVEGSPCEISDAVDIARWLRKLHDFGFGCRDPKLSNFIRTSNGPVLIDADGIRSKAQKPMRDLGRLLAEMSKESEEGEVQAAYGKHNVKESALWASRFREILERKS